ncbi:MAG TPA: DinB family protein [Gemmatimonadales bacterium]|nr:DinB family protein [Gemmatimonadales bacterium]
MTGRPLPGEYAAYAQSDIDAVGGTDAVTVLEELARETHQFLTGMRDQQVRGVRYAPDKWTLKEVMGHVVDDERIFAYRLFCLARGETLPLPGFDEKVYAARSNAEARRWEDLLEEYRVVRAATLALLRSLPAEAWLRAGEVNGYRATPRGLAFHIAGHELHHLRLIRERYLPLAVGPAGGPAGGQES